MIGIVVFGMMATVAIYLVGWPAVMAFGGIVLIMMVAALFERKRWNKGHCECGQRWRMFAMDSQGGRMYKCDECGSHVDVSYPFVDGLIS